MPLNLQLIVRIVLDQYALSPSGIHGVAHWARVLENGLRLAEKTGATSEVVQMFAVFHDSKRLKEASDREHGKRGAEFALTQRGQTFDLPDADFRLLYRACSGHTCERTHPDITVQTCWDADRLDLGRVGITPHPSRLCTEAAKAPEIKSWANGRAAFDVIPEFVQQDWGIDMDQPPTR